MIQLKKITFVLAISLLFVMACNDSSHHDHLNAEGLVLMYDGVEIFRYEAPNAPANAITVEEGQTLSPVEIKFIDRDGALFTTDNEEFNLRWTIKDTGVANIQQVQGEQWAISLTGVSQGETEVQFEVYHVDHADFETLWFDLVTTAASD